MFSMNGVEFLWMNGGDEFFEVVAVDMPRAVGLKEFDVEMSQPVLHPVVGDFHFFVEWFGERVDV